MIAPGLGWKFLFSTQPLLQGVVLICTSLGKYLELEVPQPVIEFDEDLYRKKIQEILESKAKLVKKQTPIKIGDEVLIKICGYDQENEEIPLTKDDAFQAIIGKGQMFKEFEQALIGMKAGDSISTNLVFPPNHQIYAGKAARFEIAVLTAYDRILPELNDDFVSGMNINGINTVEQLQNFTRAHVLDHQKSRLDDDFRNKVMDLIIEASGFEIAEEIIEAKVKARALEFAQIIGCEGVTMQDYLEKSNLTHEGFLEKLRRNVIYSFKYRCVVDKVAEVENINVCDEEVIQEASSAAKKFDLTFDEFIMSNPEGYEGVKKDVLKKKVVEFILGKVNFEKQKAKV